MQTLSPAPAAALITPLPSLRLPEADDHLRRLADWQRERANLADCREALRNGSRTFLAASMLLPRRVHEPACALYAFCRLADDAVDTPQDTGHGGDAIERLRFRLDMAYAGTPQAHAADRALSAVVARHGIPRSLFDALLEGFQWDLEGRRYDTLAEVHDYGARVAGSVGAMMALLMGARSPQALARACDLGVAMQLSNIARDVGEDARMGRLYLPRSWMIEAGIDPDAWLATPTFTPALGSVVKRLLDAADELYRRVDAGVATLPLGCRPGINAARFLYAEIGHEVGRRGHDSVSSRARVSPWRKSAVLMRSLALVFPADRAKAIPALAANGFLVESAAAAAPSEHGFARRPARRSVSDRVVWALDLFARLDHPSESGVPEQGAA